MLKKMIQINLLIEDKIDEINYSTLVTLPLRILRQHSHGIEELLTITYGLLLEDASVSGDEKVANIMQIFKKCCRMLTPTMNSGRSRSGLPKVMKQKLLSGGETEVNYCPQDEKEGPDTN